MTDKDMDRAKLSIRPYARLLTMLGEQLLKNGRVALVELIKNSYDADAANVTVEFDGFGNNMKMQPGSRIIVQDDGCGMRVETVKDAWMRPATPMKFLAKKKGKELTPGRNRVIQGEKGIGRFAVFKLARKITVTTRVRGTPLETVVSFDFTQYDDDFTKVEGKEKEIFLDELQIDLNERTPKTFLDDSQGTVIEMESLREEWSDRQIGLLYKDIANLTDPVSRLTRKQAEDKFEINIVRNGENYMIADKEMEDLKSLIEDKAVLSIQGHFTSEDCTYKFETASGKEEISLYDVDVKGLRVWRDRYHNKVAKEEASKKQVYSCGDFSFQFYIFDFAKGIDARYLLTKEEKNLLKNHRVYLYRDGVRVYPYGDPDDDWLNIDISRGTVRAGNYFSNDQLVGWVDITHKHNPNLRDKTNREGLIETGNAAVDFVFLIQTFLSYIKRGPYLRHQMKQKKKNEAKSVLEGVVTHKISELKISLQKAGETAYVRQVSKIESLYTQERHFLSQRAETTEDLAGVGLSVEMTSHDIMLLVGRAQDIGIRLARYAQDESSTKIRENADMLVGVLQQIVAGMRDVQSLFRSSRRRRKILRVEPIVDKIHGIYAGLLEKLEIVYNKEVVGTSPLTANTTDGVIMQVLINLFDNAAFWLDTKSLPEPREIRVTLDGDAGELIFSDNGPGVQTEDKPYIFEAFFSGKGQEGRGLGLYIMRQLLQRHGYDINLVESHKKILSGANFIVRFIEAEEL